MRVPETIENEADESLSLVSEFLFPYQGVDSRRVERLGEEARASWSI